MSKITILGSGDTLGTPISGCQTDACRDTDPKSRRYRFGLYVQVDGVNILIDPNPDIKWQMLDNDIHPKDIDHILVTHQHSDHINGLGEFYYRRNQPSVLWYGDHPLNENLLEYWRYLEREQVIQFQQYTNYEILKLKNDVNVMPVELNHGFPVSGFVISHGDTKIAVLTDTNNQLSDRTLEELSGVDYLFLDTFSENTDQIKGVYEDCNIPTPNIEDEWFHMTIEDAKYLHEKLKPKKTFTIHMSRHMAPHTKLVERYQTSDFIIGYDGLGVEL